MAKTRVNLCFQGTREKGNIIKTDHTSADAGRQEHERAYQKIKFFDVVDKLEGMDVQINGDLLINVVVQLPCVIRKFLMCH